MSRASPFRHGYLDHDALVNEIERLCAQAPALCRSVEIGRSSGGRPLLMLIVGKDPERARPALFVDANMHAMELCGSSVALAFVEDLLALHQGDGDNALVQGLPLPIREALSDSLVYVLPRMAVDGAEAVLKQGRFVRSSLDDAFADRKTPRFVARDLDGDGLSLQMRIACDTGDFVESPEMPGLMLPRRIDSVGPFYKIVTEGVIEHDDGCSIPNWGFMDDNPIDFNRNFPLSWAPESEQVGAGPFPLATPETRAVVETTSALPHLMGWIDLHTFGGVCIRPLGDKPDSKMNRDDLDVYRQIEQWFSTYLKYPTVSGYEDFLYEPEKPLRGDITDYAYVQRGCLALTVELWDLFSAAGLPICKPFVDSYALQDEDALKKLWRFDVDHNHQRVCVPWRPITHPQLSGRPGVGQIDVGGLDPRIGVWNPPPERLPALCEATSQVFVRMLALLPRLKAEVRVVEDWGKHRLIEVRVQNAGYLPTHGPYASKDLPLNTPIVVSVEGAIGECRREIGHLAGYGHGRYGHGSWPYQATSGAPTEAVARFVVSDATATVTIGSSRVGFLQHQV